MKFFLLAPLLSLLLVPLHAATPIDQTHPVNADARIEVSNVAGSIRIRGSDRSDVRITGSVGKGAKGLLVEGDQRRLSISIEHPRGSGWSGWWGGGSQSASTLEVEVPRGVEIKVQSVSASVDVAGITGARVEIDAVSGRVSLAGGPGVLQVDSVSGNIEIDAQDITEARLESVSGNIALTGRVADRLRADTVSGRVRLQPQGQLSSIQSSAVSGAVELEVALAPAGRLSAESLSGQLSLSLPRATSAAVRASSFSGSIHSDAGEVETERFGPGSSLRTTLGAGDGEIRLESFSGTVRLRLVD
jgi:DUF4097 and DUF4098 domain-containing protein YvlB